MISLQKLSADIALDIKAAIQPSVDLSEQQRGDIAKALGAWAKGNLGVPENDPRAAQLLRDIPDFTMGLRAHLDPTVGIRVVDPRSSDVGLLLERGSRWLRGGDWRSVATTRVSRETTSKP